MKSKSFFILSTVAMLASCGASSARTLELNVVCPAGAPAIAFYNYVKDGGAALEINANPANVVAYLSEGSAKDIVVAPTNAGIAAIKNKKAPFKIAATLTFGNFYLASTGKDDNDTLDDDDYVVAFQQNNVPDRILKYCYDSLSNVHYVDAASDAAQALISGKNIHDDNADVEYVLMAEPALASALAKNESAKEYANLQTVFSEKSGGAKITQASIFVNNSADKAKVNAFLGTLSGDVNGLCANADVLDTALEGVSEDDVKAKFNAPLAMVKKMMKGGNRLGLGYETAYSIRQAVENFVALFGLTDLNEEIYYK